MKNFDLHVLPIFCSGFASSWYAFDQNEQLHCAALRKVVFPFCAMPK